MNSQRVLRSMVLLSVKQCRRNIHTTPRCKLPDVYEPDNKGRTATKIYQHKKTPEEEIWEKASFKDKIKLEYNMFKKELNLFKEECKEYWRGPLILFRKGEVDVFWRFKDDPECLNEWILTADSFHGEGYSTARLDLSPIGTGIFSGNLDTRVPEDGEILHAGYCNIRTLNAMKSFQREVALDWSNYTHLRMRVRGDGRFYFINIGMKQTFDVQWFQIYKFFLMTRGGPYWQDVRIPLSKFFLTHKGRVQDKQQEIEKHKVKNFGITCSDKISGPFKLEIDYIGVEFDDSHYEECAYENYFCTTNQI